MNTINEITNDFIITDILTGKPVSLYEIYSGYTLKKIAELLRSESKNLVSHIVLLRVFSEKLGQQELQSKKVEELTKKLNSLNTILYCPRDKKNKLYNRLKKKDIQPILNVNTLKADYCQMIFNHISELNQAKAILNNI